MSSLIPAHSGRIRNERRDAGKGEIMLRKNPIIGFGLFCSLLLAGSSAHANPPNHSGSELTSYAQPCVMTDFVGGAPYPQGFGPVVGITYPTTGDAVTAGKGGKVYVQNASYSGLWVNDPTVGGILEIQLFVDGNLASVMDLTSSRITPLTWNTRHSAKGTHALMLRLYTVDFDGTQACFVDSEVEYPVLQ